MAETVWTDDELRASIAAYLEIMDADCRGVSISPTATFRRLQAGPLSARSEGAIGRRMSNLSAVFAADGLPVARRFRGSLGHVGANVTRRILALHADLVAGDNRSITTDSATLNARTRMLRGKQQAPPVGAQKPTTSTATLQVYYRAPAVCAWVLDRSNGACEACGAAAPFSKDSGEPYLEVHHVVHLAQGGSDTPDNTIATCPNCHRRLHHSTDRDAYREEVWERCLFLVRSRSSKGNVDDDAGAH